MAGKKITQVVGRGVHVPGDDIDTDRIIPARFMKCVTFDGLGQYAFYSQRFDDDGNSLNHPLDAEEHKGASVMISGRNFGCGSSREHAPQALMRFGIDGIIAENFAEIFFGNCTKLGVPCVSVSKEDRKAIATWAEEHPDQSLEIDLEAGVVRAGGETYSFDMAEGALQSLIEGEWDPLKQLISREEQIEKTAETLPYTSWSR